MKHLAVILTFVISLTLPASAENFKKSWAADEVGENTRSLKEWMRLAEQGQDFAQYNLGEKYYNGDGVPQDLAEAAKWYRLAADQGHVGARIRLDIQYAIGVECFL